MKTNATAREEEVRRFPDRYIVSVKAPDDEKDITNPYLFKDAPMLTTFVRSAGNRTKELWHFIDEASRTDVMLADVKNTMLKKMLPFCSGRVPILVHPSFYRSLKLRYPTIGSRDS